jgi:protein-disulfide isomerase
VTTAVKALGLLALAGSFLLQPPAATAGEQALSQAAIERIVRDYLLREPELLEQAFQALEKKRNEEAALQQARAIAERGAEIFAAPGDPVAGNPSGDVTLVEFFDYHCGYCRGMAPGLQELVAGDRGLRVVFKEMPVLGPDSVTAARAALAAAELDLGRYQALHLSLMAAKALDRESVLGLAEALGYDRERLAAAMEEPRIAARIDANLALAQALGVQGTPSFVIGKRFVPGAADIASLKELIAAERTKAAARHS